MKDVIIDRQELAKEWPRERSIDEKSFKGKE
jgi:hypothetical protein